MTFIELAEIVLKEIQIPLKASDIWHEAVKRGYDQKLSSVGKTPGATLAARLYVQVRDNPNSLFKATGNRPKKFYLTSFKNIYKLIQEAENEEITHIEDEKLALQKSAYLEKDLHPLLAYYAFYFLRCYTKTINHSTSTKKEYGEWVHPDMVGCYFPIEEWSREVNDLSHTMGSPAIKLYSFELKRQVSLVNLREVFFQTVSNSSWAHESYLVTAELSGDEEFMTELKRLSVSFGIGVIKLDKEEPDDSEILLPARTRVVLDWETINKLTMNKDFTQFLKRINNDLKSREIIKEKYDKIVEKDGLMANFRPRKP